ncbi:MAG TPA: S9 family peptidase [Paludibaculum sp.]|jgi:dipeptidyl aminopeptidase/acylaminoacyl peptidase
MPFSRVFCAALLAWTLPAATRPIAADDIYAFRWAADPQISADGTRVVFTQVSVNAKHDGYDTALWLVPTAGGPPRALTAGPRDSSPRWSPDGTRLAFLRAIEKDGKPQPAQIWILPMEGGEARQLTTLAKGASAPVWSPDGARIAFNSTTKPEDHKKKDDPPSDVRVITRAVYRANGGGYVDFDRPTHIWTVAVQPGQTATQITSGTSSEGTPAWSPDGARLYFTAERDPEPYYRPQDGDLYSVPSAGGAVTPALHVDSALRVVTLSPDGKSVAFVSAVNGNPIRSYSQPDLWTATLTNPQPRNLTTAYDFDIGGGPGGDQGPPRAGGGSRPVWSADGRTLFVVAEERGAANLKRVHTDTGKLESLTEGNHAVYAYSATPDAARMVVAISTPTNIGDLYLLNTDTKALTRLTNINEALFSQLKLTEPEMIWYDSFDGKKIQAWVQRPPDFQPGVKYPLILNIHGGPHAAYGYVFDHEFQWMAAKGYVVLYPNPRGSTSYGQDFGNVIQYAYPGDDYKDLMAGVDELLRRGWIDPARLGVTGGSGGGVLTNWTIGHTDRFKAAVSQRSIADWRDFWYTADFALFQPTWFRDAPWKEEVDFKARSPITYIEKITTPTMFIEGEADLRTPPTAGGEQMFRALKYRRIPTVMVQFPGESHELSRSGKPSHRVERLQHIVAWFDKFILGQVIRTYDLPSIPQ